MFGQMKSRHQSDDRSSKPCPCNGTCLCHRPKPGWSNIDTIFTAIISICLIGIVLILIFGRKTEPEHIQVDSKDCIVKHITDNCVSTGACRGHDIAICPK